LNDSFIDAEPFCSTLLMNVVYIGRTLIDEPFSPSSSFFSTSLIIKLLRPAVHDSRFNIIGMCQCNKYEEL